MSSANETSITALDFALRTERDGEEFYTRVASETQNPLVRATFTCLARDEQYHIRAIERYVGRLRADGVWEDTQLSARVSDLSGEIVTMFREAMENDQLRPGETPDDSEAYTKAAEFERKGGAFYKEQADTATDEAARRFWSFLVEEEARHLELIQETLNYLDKPGDWYLIGERGLIDGG